MNTHPSRFSRRLSSLAAAALVLLTFGGLAHAVIDDNATKQIWKLKFGVTNAQLNDNAWLLLDSDGDGHANGAEIAAGTSPFNAARTVKVSSIVKNGANVELQFPTENGKVYRIESTTTLANAGSWVLQPQPTPVEVVGDGGTKMLSAAYVANTFYRVRVSDKDSDGDGVADWAELAVTLNPNLAQTVPGTNDHAYVTEQVALPNVVTIAAATPFASEDGPTGGKMTITRTQNLFPITVTYGVGGTASGGTDYDPSLPGSVGFLARGDTTADIFVNPTVQPVLEGSKSVTAALNPPGAAEFPFTLGTPNSATVIIADSTVAAGTGLTARFYDQSSTTYAHAANFGDSANYAFTRGTPTTQGTILVTPTTGNLTNILNAVSVGTPVKLTFLAGNLNTAAFNHFNYLVSSKTASNFTVDISAATALPVNSSSTCNFSIQPFHPGMVERIDSVVNYDWVYGTPHDVAVTPNSPVDNYSTAFEGYLNPTTTGNYQFQLDADDKARVLVDVDADGPGGMVEILEHGWDGATTVETIGTFKVSAAIALAIPGSAAQRYKIRVEHVETTGDSRCRLQWREGANGFVNIPQANVFSHTQAISSYSSTGGVVTVNTTGVHGLTGTPLVTLWFSSGGLFTPPANYSGTYTVATIVDTDTFTVNIAGAPVTTGAGFLVNSASATTGWLNQIYTNTAFTAPAGYVNVIGGGPSNTNNGIWGSGTPDPLIGKDTFSARWTGQVQPQFSEEYTFVVHADDGSSLKINGQVQEMETVGSLSSGVGTYDYSSVTGEAVVNYTTSVVKPGSFIVGETVRVDPTSANLTHGTGSTYTYDGVTGVLTVNYSNLANITPGGFAVGETIELDPTLGTLSSLSTLPYVITGEPSSSTFTVYIAPGLFDSELPVPVANASTSAGSAIVTVPSTAGLVVGMAVSGTGIPANEFITAVNSGAGTITITTGTGVTAQASTTLTCTSTINIADTRNALITKLFATGATYSYNATTGDAVVTYSSVTGVAPGSFTAGMTVELDPTSATTGSLNTLTSAPYTILASPAPTATTFVVNLGTAFTTCTGNINIASPSNGVIPASITNAFAIAFGTGKYTTGSGNISVEIVNKPLKEWASMGNERYVRIPMVGGTRYDIQLDSYDNTGYSRCALYWYSTSQPKQIIPADRLYPSSVPQAPPAHVSSTVATTLANGPFSYQVAGSNGSSVTVSGLPPGLTYSGGVISGTATAAGDYQILITVTNAAGTSTSVLNLHVDATAGSIVRELWTGIAGTSVASIPTGTAPTGLPLDLTSLAAPSGVGPDYGARIRGYITAPVTGNYYFWIAANHGAELWISNDDEPVNAIKRAWLTSGSASAQNWNVDPVNQPNQKSPWLALDAGKRYYIEVLHKAGTGTGDNLAVGWLKPGDSGTVPSVVPGYVLSPYVAPAPGSTPGTLYVATMLAQSGIVVPTNGVGVATFRLSEDENSAIVNFDIPGFLAAPNYNGLTGVMTDWHVHNDPYLIHGSQIMYDPTAPPANSGVQPDGSHKWTIPPTVGPMSKAQVIELIKQGKAYINIHTTANLTGEIRGNFTLANGSRTFTPPPAPPSFADDHDTNVGAARFLQQATFGASVADIAALKALPSYEAWIDDQFTKPAIPADNDLLPEVIRTENASAQGGAFDETLTFNAWWWRSITGTDQLRQRVAFALSEIHVVSAQGPLDNNALSLAYFYDKLVDNAFGNFRDILEDTTLTPSMGRYLDMLNNDKPDQSVGRIPNENYAREIKQLFSVGLYRMWPDGTLILNSKDNPIDVYSQREIVGFAHVFTGWGYGYDGALRTSFSAPTSWVRQMREVPARHFTGPKRVLNNEVLPGLAALGTQPLDPNAVHTSNNYNDPAYQALPAQELDAAHDQLFNHPNTGPFICRQLIQRLVTSSPSRDYLYRVVQKFNNDGTTGPGRQNGRGNLDSVIKAILLDYEARSSTEAVKPAFGKQREPVLRVAAAARAFRTNTWSGTYLQESAPTLPKTARTITVTVTAGGPHGLENGDTVFLNFTSGSPAPWIGSYTVADVTATTFTVNAAGWTAGTYSIPGGSTVCTVTMGSHWLEAGNQAYFDFTTVTAGGTLPADGVYPAVTSTSNNTTAGTTFTIAVASSGAARTGNLMIPRFTPGSFTTSASGLAAPQDRRVTMDTNSNHELVLGNQVQLNFFAGSNPQPTDMVATFESNLDLNTWTFLAPSAGPTNLSPNQGNNSVYQFPLQPLPTARSGTVGNRASTFQVGNTTTDLEQAPINSPTVFNFFLPEYKFPGTLQSQGITTPEFQITAETTAIRQANYLYNGIFNSNNVNGINSFNNGNHALVMDFSPWYGVATGASGPGAVLGAGPSTGTAWTSNANLSTLIDRLNTLLVGENMSTAGKNVVLKFLDMRAITAISAQNPCRITSAGHNLNTGDVVVISGVAGGTFTGGTGAINTTLTITKIDDNVFSVPVNCTVAPTAGNLTAAVAPIVPYNNSSPSDTNKRDRLRAILHFILTSPDFTIQR